MLNLKYLCKQKKNIESTLEKYLYSYRSHDSSATDPLKICRNTHEVVQAKNYVLSALTILISSLRLNTVLHSKRADFTTVRFSQYFQAKVACILV